MVWGLSLWACLSLAACSSRHGRQESEQPGTLYVTADSSVLCLYAPGLREQGASVESQPDGTCRVYNDTPTRQALVDLIARIDGRIEDKADELTRYYLRQQAKPIDTNQPAEKSFAPPPPLVELCALQRRRDVLATTLEQLDPRRIERMYRSRPDPLAPDGPKTPIEPPATPSDPEDQGKVRRVVARAPTARPVSANARNADARLPAPAPWRVDEMIEYVLGGTLADDAGEPDSARESAGAGKTTSTRAPMAPVRKAGLEARQEAGETR
jgi:hypothetical protein